MTAHVPAHNLRFKFKTEDALGRLLYKNRTNEPAITRCFLDYVPLEEEDVVFDIGANIGWYAILFDKYSPASVSIYAFEPDLLNYGLLCSNVEKNHAQKVVAVPKALSDKSETKTLYLYPSKNLGRHSLLPINTDRKVEVATTTLDEFVEENSIDATRVKFIKVDVEGYEYFVLLGGQNLLQHVPFLHTEYSPHYLRKGGIEAAAFIDLILKHNFIPHIINEQGQLDSVSYEELIKLQKKVDLLWTKGND